MTVLVEIDGLPRDVSRQELEWLSGRRCLGIEPLEDSSKRHKKCVCRFASQREALGVIKTKNFTYIRNELISYRLLRTTPLPSLSVSNVQCTAEFQHEIFQLASAFGSVVDCRFSAASSKGTVTTYLSFLTQESVSKAIQGLKQLSTETQMGWGVRSKDSARTSSDARHKSSDKATVSIGAPTASAQPTPAIQQPFVQSSSDQGLDAPKTTPFVESSVQSQQTRVDAVGAATSSTAAEPLTTPGAKKKEKKAKRKVKDKPKKDKKDKKDKKKSSKLKRSASSSSSGSTQTASSENPLVVKRAKLVLALDSDDDSNMQIDSASIAQYPAAESGRSRVVLQPAPLPDLGDEASQREAAKRHSTSRSTTSQDAKRSARRQELRTGTASSSRTSSRASICTSEAEALLCSTSTMQLVRKLQTPPPSKLQTPTQSTTNTQDSNADALPQSKPPTPSQSKSQARSPSKLQTLSEPTVQSHSNYQSALRIKLQAPPTNAQRAAPVVKQIVREPVIPQVPSLINRLSSLRTGWTQTEVLEAKSTESQTETVTCRAAIVQTTPLPAPSRGMQTMATPTASVEVQCELLNHQLPPSVRPASTQTFVATHSTASSQTHVHVESASTQAEPTTRTVAAQTLPSKLSFKPKLPPVSKTELPSIVPCQGQISDSMFTQHAATRIKGMPTQCQYCKAWKPLIQQQCTNCHALMCDECSSHLLVFQQTIASAQHLANMLQPSQSSTIVLSDDDEALPAAQNVPPERSESGPSAASEEEAGSKLSEPDTDDDDEIILLSGSEQRSSTSRQASSDTSSNIVHFNTGSAIVEDMCVTRLRSHLYVTAVSDGACLVFQASTGRLLRKHKKVDDVAVTAVAESSHGVYYIATSSGTVQSYQLKSGRLINTYYCRKTAVSCMRSTGEFLVVGTKSGCIYVFHTHHKQPVLVFQDHSLSITSLEIVVVDGLMLLVSSSLDASVHARLLLLSTEPGAKRPCLCCQQATRVKTQEQTPLSSHLCLDCNTLLLKSQELGSTISSQCPHRSKHTFDFECTPCLLRRVTSLANNLDRHTARTRAMASSSLTLKCCACGRKRSPLGVFNFCLPCLRVLAPAEARAASGCTGQCAAAKCDLCRQCNVLDTLSSFKPEHAFYDSGWCVARATKPINTMVVVGENVVVGVANTTDNVQVHSLRHNACLLTINGAPKTAKALVVQDSELFVGFFDGTIRVFDLDSGSCLRTISPPNSDDWVYRLAIAVVEGDRRLFRGSRLGHLVSLPVQFQGVTPTLKDAPAVNRRGLRACRMCSAKFTTLADFKYHMNVEHTEAVAPKASFANQRSRTYPKAQDDLKKLIDEERAAWQEIINKKAEPLNQLPVVPPGCVRCDILGCSLYFNSDEELATHCQEHDHTAQMEQLADMAPSPMSLLGLIDSADIKQIKKQWKKLSLRWHPDRNHNALAKRVFQVFSAAYQTVTA